MKIVFLLTENSSTFHGDELQEHNSKCETNYADFVNLLFTHFVPSGRWIWSGKSTRDGLALDADIWIL